MHSGIKYACWENRQFGQEKPQNSNLNQAINEMVFDGESVSFGFKNLQKR